MNRATVTAKRTVPLHAKRMEDLYAAHMTQLVRFAYFMTGDRELAQDVAHDTFVKVFGRLAKVRDPDKVWVYLRRTLINVVNSHFRRVRLQRKFVNAEERQRPSHGEFAPDIVTTTSLADDLRALHPRRRAVIVLRYYEDLTEAQTAEVLDCSVAAVKALASRGLNDLRERMEGSDHGSV